MFSGKQLPAPNAVFANSTHDSFDNVIPKFCECAEFFCKPDKKLLEKTVKVIRNVDQAKDLEELLLSAVAATRKTG